MNYKKSGCDKEPFRPQKTCPARCSVLVQRYFFPAFLLSAVFILGACNVTKHLDQSKGEHLLVKNSIEFKSEKRLKYAQRAPLLYELNALYKQQPNRRPRVLFGQPTRLWCYYRFRNGKTKFAKWVMEKVAEPPAIYSERLTQLTAQNFENQMHQRGYLLAQCAHNAETRTTRFFPGDGLYFDPRTDTLLVENQVEAKYTIHLGPLFTIDTVRFDSPDSLVLQLLYQTAAKSHLKHGDPLDAHAFDAEKLRITNELKNRGYAYFTPNFVEFSGDSTDTRTNVTVEVLAPGDSVLHKTYRIGNIEVFSSVRPDIMPIRKDTIINGVNFRSATTQSGVKPWRLWAVHHRHSPEHAVPAAVCLDKNHPQPQCAGRIQVRVSANWKSGALHRPERSTWKAVTLNNASRWARKWTLTSHEFRCCASPAICWGCRRSPRSETGTRFAAPKTSRRTPSTTWSST